MTLADRMSLAGQRVLVVGMARSGLAAARLALARGASVHCVDLRADATAPDGATCRFGPHVAADFEDADLVVVSPGVPTKNRWLDAARAAGATVVGELGFSAEVVHAAGVTVLAVTGTNGKSSTVSFAGQLLEAAGVDPFVGGNLGRPLSELALGLLDGTMDPEAAVVEVSSYQLELLGGFRPAAGAILNLTPDHLARHGTMAAYAAAKQRIFENMRPGGIAVLPKDAPWADAPLPPGVLLARLRARPGIWFEEDTVCVQLHPAGPVERVDASGFPLPGEHNRDNLAVAVLLALAAAVPADRIDPSALRALPHRLEPVHTAAGVRWVNDSKATNIDAARIGIDGIGAGSIVLLGGQGKDGADYGDLRAALAGNSRHIIAFGASGPTIAEDLHDLNVERVATLADAVALARQLARPGDTVLLSPACASFDEFDDFEHRGRVFAALARGSDSPQTGGTA